jgi:DNA-binding response OmpR family regulator
MRRILVVEDEFFLALRIQTLLEDDDVEIVGPVGTLAGARKLANDETLDGALLDVNIVGGRVDDVVEILRRHDVPFLFVTANDPDYLPPNCSRVTVVGKPFKDDHLLREVGRLKSKMVPKSSAFQKERRRPVIVSPPRFA